MLTNHLLEFFYRKLLQIINKPHYLNLEFNKLEDLKENSYCTIENFITNSECDIFIDNINKAKKDGNKNLLGFWSDDLMSDIRFFKFQKYDPIANNKILNNALILNYHKAVTGRKFAEKSLMANHVTYKDSNQGSGGGWHRDTRFRTYFKAFIYLNDVDDSNGPLEIIEGSHKISEILKCYRSKVIMKDKFRFEQKEIDQIIKKTVAKKTKLTGKRGTLILANTKAIHRGSPLISGERYAFTIYFADPRFKKDFINLD